MTRVPDTETRRNDSLATEHPGDAYYRDAAWPIRFVERRRLAIIRKMVASKPDLTILEVGCGSGHVLRLFRDARLTGIDISQEALAAATKNLAGYQVELRLGNATAVHGRFDRVICSEVLEHVPEPERVIEAIAAQIAPGGHAVLTIPYERVIRAVKVPLRPFMRVDWGGDDFHVNDWSPSEFEAVLQRHLAVDERAFAPSRLLPIRACYRCSPRT
jgi:2-polyprenyl-3-methyl-5-hydroxy-6-metoxy-1,4-benzoquinol methylase